jgi:hypothetical protein
MVICFTVNGFRICFTIPVLFNPWWWLQPDPGPLKGGGDTGDFGEVINWVTVGGRTAEWARTAQILATTVALARRSPEVFKGLHAGFRQAAEHIQSQLPEGATIHLAE